MENELDDYASLRKHYKKRLEIFDDTPELLRWLKMTADDLQKQSPSTSVWEYIYFLRETYVNLQGLYSLSKDMLKGTKNERE